MREATGATYARRIGSPTKKLFPRITDCFPCTKIALAHASTSLLSTIGRIRPSCSPLITEQALGLLFAFAARFLLPHGRELRYTSLKAVERGIRHARKALLQPPFLFVGVSFVVFAFRCSVFE